MARFDVRRVRRGSRLLVECQSDFLSDLNTRFMVPLVPLGVVSKPIRQLNPIFVIGDQALVFFPQFALSVQRSDLGPPIVSLADEQDRIIDALDLLLTGF